MIASEPQKLSQTFPGKLAGMQVIVTPEEKAEYLERIAAICDTGWFMWGPEQEELVERAKTMTGQPHAVTYNSATSALESIFRWVAEREGGSPRVLVQGNVFPSVPMVALRAGCRVRFADIDQMYMSLTPKILEQEWSTEPFQAVVIQWNGGFVNPYAWRIKSWCESRGVFLIEDASHAAGTVGAGSHGDAAVFSLAATKAIHTGQGGLLCTSVKSLETYGFQAKNYGRTEMFQKGEYVQFGGNCHMSEMQAALGNVLFSHVDERNRHRYELARIYVNGLIDHGFELLGTEEVLEGPNYYKLPFLLPSSVDRAAMKSLLKDAGVEMGSEIYAFVTPLLGVFEKAGAAVEVAEIPVTERLSDRQVCVPLHNAMSADDARVAVSMIVEAARKAS